MDSLLIGYWCPTHGAVASGIAAERFRGVHHPRCPVWVEGNGSCGLLLTCVEVPIRAAR